MTARTFDSLKTETAAWLSREGDGFYENIFDLLVQLTETRIRKLLRTRRMQTTAAITLTADSLVAPLPEDFAGVRGAPTLRLEQGTVTLDHISRSIPDRTQLSRDPGRPQKFHIYGSNLICLPRPDVDYIVDLPYYQNLLDIGEDRQFNWVLQKYPDIYFNGIMWYAYMYLEDFDRAATWKDKFFLALRDLRRIDKHDRFGVAGNQQRSQVIPMDVPLSRAGRLG